jgi:glutamate synthase domain-containing protein 1
MRYLESFGYKCTLHTDTEVIAYLFDLLGRRHNIPLSIASLALSPPLFKEIEKLKKEYQIALKNLRSTYRSAMLNGPFSIVVGMANPVPSLIGLSDRKKLRPLVAAISEDENTVFLSSEEASFRRLQLNNLNDSFDFREIWHPNSGTAIIAQVGKGLIRDGREKPFDKIQLKIESPIEV